MPTNLTFHLSEDFLKSVTGSKDGTAAPGTQHGSWVYLYNTQPPDTADGPGNPWTVLVENGAINTTNVKPGSGDYVANVALTTAQTPTVSSAALYLIVQSEDPDPATHNDLTTLITAEGDIQPNVQNWNFGYAAFEYTLDGKPADQGDLTYIDGFGPHLAVKINGDTRGFNYNSTDFLTDLKSPTGAEFLYPKAPTGDLPYSPLDNTYSMAISPSNGSFGSNFFSPTDWYEYLDAVASTTTMSFSGTFGGAPDASAIWHNSAYFSYSTSQVTTSSDPGTKYLLFTPASNSQVQGYMLIKQTDVAANLYSPGLGNALGRMYQTATVVDGVFYDDYSTPYIIPGSSQPPGSTPTTNTFDVSANTQWGGTAMTEFFTGFTAGYWGAQAKQANPANTGGANNKSATVDLSDNINWAPAYAFDLNRSNAIPSYQHNDQYSYQYYLNANTYASAFSDNLAKQLSPGPQIALSNGAGNFSQIDLYAYGPTETDGLFKTPSGTNFVPKPASGYLIPTSSSSNLMLQFQGSDLHSSLIQGAYVEIGVYAGQDGLGHPKFDYVPLPLSNGSIFQSFIFGGSAGHWTASVAGPNPGFIQINNLPVAQTVADNDVYWYQLVVAADSEGTSQKVFNLYVTTNADGSLKLYNPGAGNGSAKDPFAATDGNGEILVNGPKLIIYDLKPADSLPTALLTNGFAYTTNTGGVQYSILAAPVAGIIGADGFAPIAGQLGTGVTPAEGYLSTAGYTNPAPSITITEFSTLAFGWTGTNNVAWDETRGILPTLPVFEDSAPFNIKVVGQVSQYTNKIMPGNVAKITIIDTTTQRSIGIPLSAVADLDGQWTTWSSVFPGGNGKFVATMQEMMPDGKTPFSPLTSAPLAIEINLTKMSFLPTGGSYLQLDGANPAAGNWIELRTTGSSMPNGTVLAYATDAAGNLIGRDGTVGVALADAVLARIGSVEFDDGSSMLQGGQSLYLKAGQQLHFAVQTGDNVIEQVPGVTVSGSGGSASVHVSGAFGTLDLSAVVDNTLSGSEYLSAAQRASDRAWTYLTSNQTVQVEVAGSADNINTIHFVRVDVNAVTGALSVGGVAYDNTAAFRDAVKANWDGGFLSVGGAGDFHRALQWTASSGEGYYIPVLATQGGDIFVPGTANIDGREHIRSFGGNTFGFEDLRADQGADFDYNDHVAHLTVL